MVQLTVFLLGELLEPVDFHLAQVYLVLILLDLNPRPVVLIFLRCCDSVQLDCHLFDLLRLRVVDIRLSCDVLVALLDLQLRLLKLVSHVPFALLGLRQLDLDVAQRVFQLLVLYLAQAEHLSVFDFRAFLAFNSQASTHDSILLWHRSSGQCQDEW
mgnify:FL=1